MLRVTLSINDETISDYEIRNVGPVPGEEEHLYTVSPILDGTTVGEVLFSLTHNRKRGALFLATKALLRLSTTTHQPQDPQRREQP